MKYCALIRQTWFETAKKHMTDLERLAFYEACFVYEFTGELPSEKTCKYSSVLMMFDMVKLDLQNDKEKAEKIAERNANNGRLGGRPKKVYDNLPEDENPAKPNKTQQNPVGNFGLALDNIQLHNTTTLQAAKAGGGLFDIEFFDHQIWPRLNKSGKFNTRHRKCIEIWEGFSERKRAAISKAVLSDIFVGADNPYFYLEDFAEPEPTYLSGLQCDTEWKAGRSVWMVQIAGNNKYISTSDKEAFGIIDAKEMKPREE